MVVRFAIRGAEVTALRRAAAPAAAFALAAGLVLAQDPSAAPAPQQLARVVVEKAPLRCWPSQVASPPVFEDVLAKDEVVEVGKSEGGFRAVVLPLGPVGYVSKKFTVEGEGGALLTKGGNVSFRYRPRTTEAPVEYLADATPLAVVGEDGDWWRVRVASVPAWLPETDLQVVPLGDAAATEAHQKTLARFAGEVEARKQEIARLEQVRKQQDADLAALALVEQAFAKELEKPAAEQRFDGLAEALAKLDATIAPESAAKPQVAALARRIETQRWIAEAVAVKEAKPVPATDIQPVVQPKDELERFQSIGWLRYESSFTGPGTYYLEKGGKRLHNVVCSTGRYDLALFLDREVGLMGPRRKPAVDGVSNLDIERIEVLGAPSR